jgi:hypothetical protein
MRFQYARNRRFRSVATSLSGKTRRRSQESPALYARGFLADL